MGADTGPRETDTAAGIEHDQSDEETANPKPDDAEQGLERAVSSPCQVFQKDSFLRLANTIIQMIAPTHRMVATISTGVHSPLTPPRR
jgi:hypothetical protein